jgi:hypothetical protein
MSGLTEFATIAWPGLLVLAGFVALIIHGAREHRRRHPRGRWRVRFQGPHGVLTAEHELTEQEAAQVAEVARRLLGEPLRVAGIEVRADPSMPHGEFELRSGGSVARGRVPGGEEQELRRMTSAHSRGLHRGERADSNCVHCAVRDADPARAGR